MQSPEDFFTSSHPPVNYKETIDQVKHFVELHNKNETKIALVTVSMQDFQSENDIEWWNYSSIRKKYRSIH